MKVLHINSAQHWSGGEVYTYLLCKELNREGVQVTLACRSGSSISEKFKAENLPILETRLRNATDFMSVQSIAKFCRNREIEIIHCHLGRDYWIAFWVKLLCPFIKVIVTRHVLFPMKNSFIHKLMFAKIDKFIAVSSEVRKCLEQSQIDINKIEVIYNGIDTERFLGACEGKIRNELRSLDENTILIGIVGQVSPHKGVEAFIQAIPEITKKHKNIKFLVVGSDFKEGKYIDFLQERASQYGVAEHVVFLGERDDIPAIMKDLDILVHLSYSEAFGIVLVEAMIAGTAVITTNVGAIPEIIENEVNGLLIEPDNLEQLIAAVSRIIRDQSFRNKLIENSKEKALRNFDIRIMSRNIIRVYQETIGM